MTSKKPNPKPSTRRAPRASASTAQPRQTVVIARGPMDERDPHGDAMIVAAHAGVGDEPRPAVAPRAHVARQQPTATEAPAATAAPTTEG
jgi:hypothetical protein